MSGPSGQPVAVQRREAVRGDLHLRLLVAAIGVPLCAMVVFAGGIVFALGLGLVAALGYWELAIMYRSAGARPLVWPGALGAGALPVAVLYFGGAGAWVVGALLLMASGGLATARVTIREGPGTAAALTAFGALYVGGLLSFGVPLREGVPPGVVAAETELAIDRLAATLLFFFPVVTTWLADTAAYFGGKSLGRRRLAPKVSPNKTVEGAVAALIVGPLAALAYSAWVLPGGWDLRPGRALLFGFTVAAAAIAGDLVESALKRETDVKDSSDLLPGHGGLLDRLDSLLWALPAAYFFYAWVP